VVLDNGKSNGVHDRQKVQVVAYPIVHALYFSRNQRFELCFHINLKNNIQNTFPQKK